MLDQAKTSGALRTAQDIKEVSCESFRVGYQLSTLYLGCRHGYHRQVSTQPHNLQERRWKLSQVDVIQEGGEGQEDRQKEKVGQKEKSEKKQSVNVLVLDIKKTNT